MSTLAEYMDPSAIQAARDEHRRAQEQTAAARQEWLALFEGRPETKADPRRHVGEIATRLELDERNVEEALFDLLREGHL